MTTRELLQQALDALEQANELAADLNSEGCFDEQIEALRAHLAKPEPTPVAWMVHGGEIWNTPVCPYKHGAGEPLFKKEQL
jgi:hypothetical protein